MELAYKPGCSSPFLFSSSDIFLSFTLFRSQTSLSTPSTSSPSEHELPHSQTSNSFSHSRDPKIIKTLPIIILFTLSTFGSILSFRFRLLLLRLYLSSQEISSPNQGRSRRNLTLFQASHSQSSTFSNPRST